MEREEAAPAPYLIVYILRPASPGKILRGYEEYDSATEITPETTRRT